MIFMVNPLAKAGIERKEKRIAGRYIVKKRMDVATHARFGSSKLRKGADKGRESDNR